MGRWQGDDLYQRAWYFTDVRIHRAVLLRGGTRGNLGHKQDWPSTGLPTRTQQGDLSMCYEASHGDTQHIVLIPGTVDECFEFGWRAFDYAERFQTLVFGFGDLDLGMNRWSTSGFDYPDEEMDRGKVIRNQEQMDAIPRFRKIQGC